MPSKNRIKEYAADSYYHIYNRGVAKQDIFREKEDYLVFLNYLKTALTPPVKVRGDKPETRRKSYDERLELLSYCLLPNHFHLLVYQHDSESVASFMRSVMTGYVMYFNKKYDRVGPLFQGRYKGSRIDHESYLYHISRYIHLNPLDINKDYLSYDYSSIKYFLGEKSAEWVNPKRVLRLHNNNIDEYINFLSDYEDIKSIRDNIKKYLADA